MRVSLRGEDGRRHSPDEPVRPRPDAPRVHPDRSHQESKRHRFRSSSLESLSSLFPSVPLQAARRNHSYQSKLESKNGKLAVFKLEIMSKYKVSNAAF